MQATVIMHLSTTIATSRSAGAIVGGEASGSFGTMAGRGTAAGIHFWHMMCTTNSDARLQAAAIFLYHVLCQENVHIPSTFPVELCKNS